MSEEQNTRTVELEPNEIVVQVSCLENLYRTGATMEELTRGAEEARGDFLEYVRDVLWPGAYVSLQIVEGDPKLGHKVFRSDNSSAIHAVFGDYYADGDYGLWEDENASIPVVKLEVEQKNGEGRCVMLLAHWWHYDYLIPE